MNEYLNHIELLDLYWNRKLSLYQIAKLLNVSSSTIYRLMEKFNIPKRNCGYALHLAMSNHCKLSQKTINWISGEMLGDGCLYSQSKYSAIFDYGSKHWEYINYIADILKSFGIKQSGKIQKRRTHGNNTLFPNAFHYHSCSYVELKILYDKWYPNGKKIIPKDIKLTPITLRQWYIGDGGLFIPNRGRKSIILSTYSFSINGVNLLVEKLNNIGFKVTRRPSNNTIKIWVNSCKDFLNYIGKCPVKCYQYKWQMEG